MRSDAGLIRAYGLFWNQDQVLWFPGAGRANEYRLLGRYRGIIADMRRQSGIYVLHDDYGVYYVGLAERPRLGARLKSHVKKRRTKWKRFSWFGFRPVTSRKTPEGIWVLDESDKFLRMPTRVAIRDLEALLTELLGPKGAKVSPNFRDAKRWEQIGLHEANRYSDKRRV